MSLAIVIKVKIFLLKNNDSQHVIFDCLEWGYYFFNVLEIAFNW